MLWEIFKEIKDIDKKFYSISENGNQFESRFINRLKSFGFNQITKKGNTDSIVKELSVIENLSKDIIEENWKKLKIKILEKNSIELVPNNFKKVRQCFIHQPFGSQNFPDFLIFLNDIVMPIEIKFSTNTSKKDFKLDTELDLNSFRPMWNSNLPKPNAIYIYAISGITTTFFKGADVLDYDTRKILLDFFENLGSDNNCWDELNHKLSGVKNDFGFYPYIRKAYEQKNEHSTYIDKNNNKVVESYFSENRINRENNVISFLMNIEKNN